MPNVDMGGEDLVNFASAILSSKTGTQSKNNIFK